ncbi:zinc finger CCHC domain-containing protein 8 isoform X2 [Vanessa cardui]|uniref:zinc finger CCHC domain-containing protein 8 isoform X2 n=1 Tax=Vanessa cardui TaxID=171605 RepID=UPI001F13F1DB|nr:zinc finger CCHC domain-containing protein 8 isoform X2 [Vanessa cardui]
MAKRKAGVNDIVFELDNDDIEISSDDDAKEPKKGRLGTENVKKTCENKTTGDRECVEVISIDSSEEIFSEVDPQSKVNNGGKIPSEETLITTNFNVKSDSNNIHIKQSKIDNCRNPRKDCLNTIIFDNDIVVDSPASNSDLGVVGCENRTPLISVRFKDKKLAHVYKKKIKGFLINLLKSRSDEKNNDTHESDNELDIWPEDLVDEDCNKEEISNPIDDGLFFVDTEPCDDKHIEIPKYSQNSSVISNAVEEESPPVSLRRRQICFNCDGEHQLRECPLPRDNHRIAENRKAFPAKVGRYHVEDDQKYGHLVPGRISSTLRNALGLKRYELPLHIYRMRLLGYPPGWLEEARISHSGITMFDSTGTAILDPEEEEGEVCEPGSKDKFDIKKILDFPGFNVSASSQYVEEAHLFGLPPMSEQDSKMMMLQALAPNAVKAYKRKKLLLFPTSNNTSLQGQAEMELDSDDEVVFPLIPPLPDEEPPSVEPPPPPPPLPPPDDQIESISPNKPSNNKTSTSPEKQECNKTKSPNNKTGRSSSNSKKDHSSNEKIDLETSSDVEVIEVLQVNDIPVPEDDLITIDEDFDSMSPTSSGRQSPTLDDLEKKKRLLLNALKSDVVPVVEATIDLSESIETEESVSEADSSSVTEIEDSKGSVEKEQQNDVKKEVDRDDGNNDPGKQRSSVDVTENLIETNEVAISPARKTDQSFPKVQQSIGKDENVTTERNINKDDAVNEQHTSKTIEVSKLSKSETETEIIKQCNDTKENEVTPSPSVSQTNDSDKSVKTPNSKAGQVKTTQYGTPVINVASTYMKLPSEDKFSKDICDVINFENLPNSTGKFKQISTLLKKVKSVVDMIQDS